MSSKNVPLNNGTSPNMQVEVAVIGAGTSGLYTAYRLTEAQKYTGSQIQIFDMSDRIGGRLESVVMPGMNFYGELGGMRYLTSQQIVTTLIEGYPLTEPNLANRTKVLNYPMTPIDFPMGDPSKLYAYLRKERMMQDAWTQAQAQSQKLATRYYLNPDDEGYSSDQLFNKLIYDVLVADPWFTTNFAGKVANPAPYEYTFELTSADWDQVKPNLTYCFTGSPYDQRKVNDIGFWNLIKDQVSQEGYVFLANAGGYYSNTINWNAAEAFPYMVGDFSNASVTYKTIEEGYDSIAYALADAYMQNAGACIWSENKLITFTKDHGVNSYTYELTFLNLPSGNQWKVYANTIVLGMPRRSLELLDQNNFFFDINTQPELNENIRSVIKEPAFKILMGFEHPWWKDLDIDSGHSITDLPMRQCYYFGTDASNDHSMLLGSYGDMETETFWKALSDDKVLFTVRATKSAPLEKLKALEGVQASQMMVDELMNQLKEVHGIDIAHPYVTWFRDWTDDPYGAGYHAWKAGYSVKDVMPYMRKPMGNENIHIIGEAYSDQQGWVEGAFCEAEKMLQEHFDMSRPTWLDSNYYLGW